MTKMGGNRERSHINIIIHITYLITYQYAAQYATSAASGNQSSTSAMQCTTATAGKGNMPWLVDCCQHATANTNSTRPLGTSAVHHATTASNHKVLSRIQEHLNQATSQPQNIRNDQATFNKFTNHIVTTTRKHPVQ